MNVSLARDWPVYIILAGFIWFLTYVYIHSQREAKKKKEVKK